MNSAEIQANSGGNQRSTVACVRATVELSFVEIDLELRWYGGDLVVDVRGGAAHVGCLVLAVPRLSLSGDGSASCTSSVINATGHKDECIVRPVAEALCRSGGCVVAGIGGVHVDGVTSAQLAEFSEALPNICQTAEALLAELGVGNSGTTA